MFSDKTLLISRGGRENSPDILTGGWGGGGGGAIRNRGEKSITSKGYKSAKIKKL